MMHAGPMIKDLEGRTTSFLVRGCSKGVAQLIRLGTLQCKNPDTYITARFLTQTESRSIMQTACAFGATIVRAFFHL